MKKKQLLYKTPTKPISFYKSLKGEKLQSYVEERANKLHEINNQRRAGLEQDDFELTCAGKFDIDFNCDLYCVCL